MSKSDGTDPGREGNTVLEVNFDSKDKIIESTQQKHHYARLCVLRHRTLLGAKTPTPQMKIVMGKRSSCPFKSCSPSSCHL